MTEIVRADGYGYLTKSIYEAAMRGEPCDTEYAYFDGESSLYLIGNEWKVSYTNYDLADAHKRFRDVFLWDYVIGLGKCPDMDIDAARMEAKKIILAALAAYSDGSNGIMAVAKKVHLHTIAAYSEEIDKIVVGSELKG